MWDITEEKKHVYEHSGTVLSPLGAHKKKGEPRAPKLHMYLDF